MHNHDCDYYEKRRESLKKALTEMAEEIQKWPEWKKRIFGDAFPKPPKGLAVLLAILILGVCSLSHAAESPQDNINRFRKMQPSENKRIYEYVFPVVIIDGKEKKSGKFFYAVNEKKFYCLVDKEK